MSPQNKNFRFTYNIVVRIFFVHGLYGDRRRPMMPNSFFKNAQVPFALSLLVLQDIDASVPEIFIGSEPLTGEATVLTVSRTGNLNGGRHGPDSDFKFY